MRNNYLTPTLISLWSAMFGGALGSSAGLLGGCLPLSVALGASLGTICSIIIVLAWMGLMHTLSLLVGPEFGDMPLGTWEIEHLTGVLGGTGGAVGAVVLNLTGPHQRTTDPGVVFLCWSVSALIPIGMIIVIARFSKRHTGANG